jgi:hypothetical protein
MRTSTARWVGVFVYITFAGSHGSKSEGITSFPDPVLLSVYFNRKLGNWECRCLRDEEATKGIELSVQSRQDSMRLEHRAAILRNISTALYT